MMDIVGSLKNLVNLNKVCIDNNVFRLHYRVTVLILIGCSILVTSRQYIGDPIDCVSDSDAALKNIMDTFCWIHSTYTIAVRDSKSQRIVYQALGEDDYEPMEAHPGISPILHGENKVQYHTYYQWVWCVLFLQAVFFYLPHYLWKTLEGGRIKTLVFDFLNAHVISADKKSEKMREIIDYFEPNRGYHVFYFASFVLCEVLNFVNVLVQIFVTDAFLGHEFTSYGLKVLQFTQSKPYQRSDPMARVFPTVTSCEISRYGPSGKIVTHDALCVLPINILNEKIYIFLWFWFILLATLSGCAIMYRLAVSSVPWLRVRQIKSKTRGVPDETISTVAQHYGLGDWFLLVKLGRNMNEVTFGELLKNLAAKIKPKDEFGQQNKNFIDP